MATLYRGTCNNGVHTFFSAEAYELLCKRQDLISSVERSGRHFDPAYQSGHAVGEAVFPLSAIKVATFVRNNPSYATHFRGYVTGTFEDLDVWSEGHSIVQAYRDNFVPFSNGNLERELEYRLTPAEVIAMFELHR